MARSKAEPKIVFEATIPRLMSAINIDGDAGARIKLDIPESDIEAAHQLCSMRGKVLKVTIEVDE